MSKLCGIDSSTKLTSISYFDNGKFVEYKLIDKSKIKHGWDRVNPMLLEIKEILDLWSPDIIYQEDAYMKTNPETMMMLSNIMGGVRFWAITNGAEYHKIKPSSWRAQLGLNSWLAEREELKAKTMDFIKEKYKIDIPTDDVSDSICIGLSGVKLQELNNN